MVVLITSLGCSERKADLSECRQFSSEGLLFNYPGNWKIEMEMNMELVRLVTVESPGDAVLFVFVYEDSDLSLKDFAEDFASNTAGEIPMGGTMKSTMVSLSDDKGYQWMKEAVEMKLFGQSVPHTRWYGCKKMKGKALYVIFQVSDEDVEMAHPGFELVCDSLRLE